MNASTLIAVSLVRPKAVCDLANLFMSATSAALIPVVIGITATVLDSIDQIPQVIKTVRHQSFDGLSILPYTVHTVSCTMWIIFGILIESYVLCLSSSLSLVYSCTILGAYANSAYKARCQLKVTSSTSNLQPPPDRDSISSNASSCDTALQQV